MQGRIYPRGGKSLIAKLFISHREKHTLQRMSGSSARPPLDAITAAVAAGRW